MIFLLKNKKGVFDRLSEAAFGIKRSESRKSSHDSLLGSCAVIDANFVELSEDIPPDSGNKSKSGTVPNTESITNSNSFDPEILNKLREYLKTRSQEEISEIFEEIRKTLENKASKDKSKSEFNNEMKGIPYNERRNIRENLKSAFRFCSETASRGKERIIAASRVVSSAASSAASEGKESIKVSSRMLNNKWNELSPRDRKIISEVLIALIEIGLLKGSSRSKKAAFAILSSITRHQTPGKDDLEQFMEGAQKFFRNKR